MNKDELEAAFQMFRQYADAIMNEESTYSQLSPDNFETPEFLKNIEVTEEDKLMDEYWNNNIDKIKANRIKKFNEIIEQIEQWKKENPENSHDKANNSIADLNFRVAALEGGFVTAIGFISKKEIREMMENDKKEFNNE